MTTNAPPVPQAAAQLQFVHLEKIYGYLPGLADALPDIFDVTPQEYTSIREHFDRQARDAARDLLNSHELAKHVDRLPFEPGARILAVGDSLTDDLQSWAQVLQHVLAVARPDDDIIVVNGGLSAHTTAMVMRRWPSMLNPRPDWIICALGTNDVTRVAGGKPQVSPAETIANLQELRRVARERTRARWVWMTPATVNEDKINAHRPFQYGASSWRNGDITTLINVMRGFDEPVVDLAQVFGVPARDDLQGVDGVHPSLAGQQQIAAALIRELAP